MNERQHGEDNEMQTSQSFREPFIVVREPSKPVEPVEAAFNHPSSKQKNNPLFGLRQLADPQCDTFIARDFRGLFARVALVGKGQLHCLAAHMLYLLHKIQNLGALLFGGRRHMYREQTAQRVDGHLHLAALLALVAVIPPPAPRFRRVIAACTHRESPRWADDLCTYRDAMVGKTSGIATGWAGWSA
jgi:hypothetical protein